MELNERVRQLYEAERRGDRGASGTNLVPLLEEFGADRLKDAMREVDPKRLVWDHPILPGETGLHGFPMAQARFRFCSNRYGHEIRMPPDGPGDIDHGFLDACEKGYEDGLLHDAGNVVLDRETGRAGFLINVRLEDTTVFTEADLAALSAECGVTVSCMAWPNLPEFTAGGVHVNREFVCLTALLTSADQFGQVEDILQAMYAADVAVSARTAQAAMAPGGGH